MFMARLRIDQLSSVTGFVLNSHEQAQIVQSENDIEELKEEQVCKNQLLEFLNEQIENSLAEQEAQIEFSKSKAAGLKDEVERCKANAKILHTYLDCMYNNDTLMVNTLRRDVDNFNSEFWTKLKPVMDRYHQIVEELKSLKEYYQKNLELQNKATSLMAPAH